MSDVRVTVVPTDDLVDDMEAIRSDIAKLVSLLDAKQRKIEKRWYTLREAAELKGISFEVLRKMPGRYYPNFGRSTEMVKNSRKYNRMYRADHVYAWLDKAEEDIDREYREMLRGETA